MLGIIFLVLSLTLALSSGQLVQNGQCDPNIQLVEDFDVTQVRIFLLVLFLLLHAYVFLLAEKSARLSLLSVTVCLSVCLILRIIEV